MYREEGEKNKKLQTRHLKTLLITLIITLSTITFTSPTYGDPSSTIRINEIMYDPEGTDSGREWIEIYNTADYPINITNWKLYENDINHTLKLIQGNMEIPTNGYAVIANNDVNFLIDYPDFQGTLIDSSFSLKNTGEYIAIKNKNGETIDGITYIPQEGADGTGMTLEYQKNNIWMVSLVYGGTPGRINSCLKSMTVTKTIWDGDNYVSEIDTQVGDVIRFNINITNTGYENYILYDIVVVDTLPDILRYSNYATLNHISREPDNIDGQTITWTIASTEMFLRKGESAYLEFNALVTDSGTGINIANVTSEYCDPDILYVYDEDSASVNATMRNFFEKKVWNEGQWDDGIIALLSSTIRFNITFIYNGESILTDINITDILPNILEYADNATPEESGYSIENNTVWWNIPSLFPNESLSIEFDASAAAVGTRINTATIAANKGGNPEQITMRDIVEIIIIYQGLTAYADGPYEGIVNQIIYINGSASGGIAPYNYSWDLDDDNVYDDAYESNVTCSWDTPGIYNISLKVVDDSSNEAYDDTTVIISTEEPLTADAGGPYSGEVNQTIFLNGSASGGVQPYNFSWDLDNDGLYNDAYGDNTTYSWDTPDLYIIGLKVVDSFENIAINYTTVNISYPDLVADAGGPYTGGVSEDINLHGSATGGIPPYNFSWDLDNDGEYDDASGEDVTHSWNTPGIYTISLKVVDHIGTEAVDDTTVEVWESKLNVNITKPVRNYFYFRDRMRPILSRLLRWNIAFVIGFITIEVDIENGIPLDRIEFYTSGQLQHTIENPGSQESYSWRWKNRSFFGYTLNVVAYDEKGNKAEDSLPIFIINFGLLSWIKN